MHYVRVCAAVNILKMPLHGSVSVERQSMRSDMFNNFTVIEFNVRDIYTNSGIL